MILGFSAFESFQIEVCSEWRKKLSPSLEENCSLRSQEKIGGWWLISSSQFLRARPTLPLRAAARRLCFAPLAESGACAGQSALGTSQFTSFTEKFL